MGTTETRAAETRGKTMKLMNTNDEAITTISALLIGQSGCGKTTSLRTLPKTGTVIACSERSLLPLRGLGYDVLRLEEWADLAALHEMFMHPEATPGYADAGPLVQACKVLVIDSLSDVSAMCAKHILTVDRKVITSERSGGKEDRPKGIYEEQMTLADYGLYGTRMLNLISSFAHLPIHFIATCVEGQKDNADGSCRMKTVNLMGKQAAENCPAYFDIVLNMAPLPTDDGKHKQMWKTFNDGICMGKDSSGKLDPYEPTNWTALFKKIRSTGAKTDATK